MKFTPVGSPPEAGETLVPRYSVRPGGEDICHFVAHGDQPLVTQALFDAVRSLSGPFGLVLVELEPVPQEWVASLVSRSSVLEALLSLRDLLGRGHLDIAVFSNKRGIEIFLDRFGTLEFRTVAWEEARLRRLLEGRNFKAASQLPAVPHSPGDPPPWDERSRQRVAAVRNGLGLDTEPPPEDENSP